MATSLLTAKDAATALGISVLTLYGWLGQSDAGTFAIRAQPVTITYYQGGRNGQGRIKINAQEIERLLSIMRVAPRPTRIRKQPTKTSSFPHITAVLGRPEIWTPRRDC